MNIDDLNKSISEMTEEELYQHLAESRTRRRETPSKPVRKTSKKSKNPLAKAIEKMTPEERQKLLEELDGS